MLDAYVQLSEDALQDDKTINMHGLHTNSDMIKAAKENNHAGYQFCQFMSENVHFNEVCILVTYNGKICEVKWIYKLFLIANSAISM